MNRVVIVETLRRHLRHPAFVIALILLVMLALGVSFFDRPGSAWPSMVSLLALITGCAVIGPEFSSGTLQLILVKPVNRAVYLLSRVTGVVLVVWLAAAVAAIAELAGRAIWGQATLPAKVIGITLLNAWTDAILAVALLALLGSVTRAYFNIAIYVAALFGLNLSGVVFALVRQSRNAAGMFLAANPAIETTVQMIEQNLFPELPPGLDPAWTVMVLSNAAIALLLACLAFRRREVPYGAD